jgi:general transcription factor 3C protein 4
LSRNRASRPADFSYKHDAQHNSVFVVAKMWEDDPDVVDRDAYVLDELTQILSGAATGDFIVFIVTQVDADLTGSGHDPIHLLRSTFLYLRDEASLQRLHQRLLGILSLHPFTMADPSLAMSHTASALPSWQEEVTPDMRRSFRMSLRRDLFGWSDLMSLRMRLSLADYCWVSAPLVLIVCSQ